VEMIQDKSYLEIQALKAKDLIVSSMVVYLKTQQRCMPFALSFWVPHKVKKSKVILVTGPGGL
jgi:hypothetical protein